LYPPVGISLSSLFACFGDADRPGRDPRNAPEPKRLDSTGGAMEPLQPRVSLTTMLGGRGCFTDPHKLLTGVPGQLPALAGDKLAERERVVYRTTRWPTSGRSLGGFGGVSAKKTPTVCGRRGRKVCLRDAVTEGRTGVARKPMYVGSCIRHKSDPLRDSIRTVAPPPTPVNKKVWANHTFFLNLSGRSVGWRGMEGTLNDIPLSRPNRAIRRQPHRNRAHWCDGCDAQLVHDGQRCPLCGFKDAYKTREKKPMPILADWECKR
jgi:hypothetical protein